MDECKIIFLGQSGVGKTSLVQRCVNMGSDVHATIGVAFYRKLVWANNHEVRLNIWDTSGQERYASLSKIYVRGAKCAVIVFDITDRDTFCSMNMWKKICEDNDIPHFVIIANKIDMKDYRVSEDEVREWCNRNLVDKYIFTSALENQGHEELITALTAVAARYPPTTRLESLPITRDSCQC